MALTETQYQRILRGYQQTQDRNRHLLEQRREQVYDRIPEYRELELRRSQLASERLQALLNGETVSGSPFEEIQSRKRALLLEAGFPEDYLEPIYDCPRCRDTGYCLTEEGTGKKCTCFQKQEVAFLYEQSNMSGLLKTDRFSALSHRYCQGEDLDRLMGAERIARQFVQDFPAGENLLFYGTVGTGKSFLSGCIANELLERGYSVVYFSATGLFDLLARYSFTTKDKESLYNFCKDLYNYDLVIVDDLGTEILSSFVASQLFTLINERDHLKKSTLISTNLNLEELRDRYSDRVFSRITHHFTICKLTGPDVRMCQKLGN